MSENENEKSPQQQQAEELGHPPNVSEDAASGGVADPDTGPQSTEQQQQAEDRRATEAGESPNE